jgi:uncharacterized membrane protein
MTEQGEAPSPTHVGTERLLAFSDGVFAIAITLLVLDVSVPRVRHGLGTDLLDEWPAYISYVLSFIVIGIIWAQHHHVFSLIERCDHVFRLINVLFLMWVAFLPFPTALLAQYLSNPGEQHLAMEIYAGAFLVGTLPFNLLWWYPAHHELLVANVGQRAVSQITRSYHLGVVIYLVDFVLAFISVPASLILAFLTAIFYAVSPLPGSRKGVNA